MKHRLTENDIRDGRTCVSSSIYIYLYEICKTYLFWQNYAQRLRKNPNMPLLSCLERCPLFLVSTVCRCGWIFVYELSFFFLGLSTILDTLSILNYIVYLNSANVYCSLRNAATVFLRPVTLQQTDALRLWTSYTVSGLLSVAIHSK